MNADIIIPTEWIKEVWTQGFKELLVEAGYTMTHVKKRGLVIKHGGQDD